MKRKDTDQWTADSLLGLGRSYQAAAVFAAAAELDVFDALAAGPLTAGSVARKLRCDLRGVRVLLNALTALGLLTQRGEQYSLPARLGEFLTSAGPSTILGMTQHQANCLRRWAQLANVVKRGRPVRRGASVRGASGDVASFIEAMHNVSAPHADHVIRAVQPLRFTHLLDIGGASGTWTMALLRACASGRATLFDLPHVIPMARRRLTAAGMIRRVKLVAGDFMRDALPTSADLAWLSAIVHQNSRRQNRALFAKVFRALVPGGRIAIRDVLMEPSRTGPVAGALFAVNMLVATSGGGTFTFDELQGDLESAGFVQCAVQRRDAAMNSIIVARKPR